MVCPIIYYKICSSCTHSTRSPLSCSQQTGFSTKGVAFDSVFRCPLYLFFPWESIVQVVFQPITATVEQDNDVEDEEISDDLESPSQDKNTDERVDAQALEPASPFAVISNDSFEEDESEEEKVDSVSKNLYLH